MSLRLTHRRAWPSGLPAASSPGRAVCWEKKTPSFLALCVIMGSWWFQCSVNDRGKELQITQCFGNYPWICAGLEIAYKKGMIPEKWGVRGWGAGVSPALASFQLPLFFMPGRCSRLPLVCILLSPKQGHPRTAGTPFCLTTLFPNNSGFP